MGWDAVKIPNAGRVDVLRHVLSEVAGGDVKHAYTTDDAVYLALRDINPNNPHCGEVIGVVVVYEYRPDGWVAFKWLSEDQGPCYYDAPPSLLRKLTVPDSKIGAYGRAWRDKCRARHESVTAARRVECEIEHNGRHTSG